MEFKIKSTMHYDRLSCFGCSRMRALKGAVLDILDKRKAAVSFAILAFLLFAFASITYAILSTTNFEQITFAGVLYMVGRFAALTGFLFISFLVISGDTARFFDRFYGIDRIIKFQRKFAIVTYFVVFSHPLLFILSDFTFLNFLIPDFTLLPLAAGTLGLYAFAAIMLSSLNYKKISYNTWQYLHILTYILFFLIFYHSSNMTSYAAFLPIRVMYWTLFAGVVIGITYRAAYKIKQRKHDFKVKEVKWETKDTFSLILEGNKLKFKPGQFCFLRIEKPGVYARHPFSISSRPNDKDLRFTIKLEGKFTQEASKLKKGEKVKLEGPFGNFIIQDKKKDLVFIAGGVGITPFMSMTKDNSKPSGNQKVILLYGSKTEKDIIFRKELDSVKKGRFKKVYVLSREKKKGKFEKGNIGKEILEKYVGNMKGKQFYICGPEKMKDNVIKSLREMNVKRSDIFYEDFFW